MRAVLLLFVLWSVSTLGQSLVWRITPAQGGAVGYIMGTVHGRDARAYTHLPLARAAMQHVDQVLGELDMELMEQPSLAHMQAIMLPPGVTLKDLLSPRRFRAVSAAMSERLGPVAPMAMRMKPFYIMGMLELDMDGGGGDSLMVLDARVQELARDLGLRTGGLETMEEQLAAVEAIPLARQADILYQGVSRKTKRGSMDQLLDAYAQADLRALARQLRSMEQDKVVAGALLTGRNAVMTARMDSLLSNGHPCLFAVGAAHLLGPTGHLEALRRLGYRVEAVLREDQLP